MGSTLPHAAAPRHRVLSDIRPTMARAHVRQTDTQAVPDFRASVGSAIERAVASLGWSLKEFAAAIGHDERQVARWLQGKERPHFDALFAVEALRRPLLIALAELMGDAVEIETIVRVKTR